MQRWREAWSFVVLLQCGCKVSCVKPGHYAEPCCFRPVTHQRWADTNHSCCNMQDEWSTARTRTPTHCWHVRGACTLFYDIKQNNHTALNVNFILCSMERRNYFNYQQRFHIVKTNCLLCRGLNRKRGEGLRNEWETLILTVGSLLQPQSLFLHHQHM